MSGQFVPDLTLRRKKSGGGRSGFYTATCLASEIMDEQIISRTPQGQKEQLEEKLLSTEKKVQFSID